MSNVSWSVSDTEETDRVLRAHLARQGSKKGALSKFVTEAVQARLFVELMVGNIKKRNQSCSQKEILDAVKRRWVPRRALKTIAKGATWLCPATARGIDS